MDTKCKCVNSNKTDSDGRFTANNARAFIPKHRCVWGASPMSVHHGIP